MSLIAFPRHHLLLVPIHTCNNGSMMLGCCLPHSSLCNLHASCILHPGCCLGHSSLPQRPFLCLQPLCGKPLRAVPIAIDAANGKSIKPSPHCPLPGRFAAEKRSVFSIASWDIASQTVVFLGGVLFGSIGHHPRGVHSQRRQKLKLKNSARQQNCTDASCVPNWSSHTKGVEGNVKLLEEHRRRCGEKCVSNNGSGGLKRSSNGC